MSWLSSGGGALGRFFNRRERRTEATGDTDLLVVRRGMSPAFYFFCRIFAGERRLLMIEDRRVKNRRFRQRPTPTTDRRQYEERRCATTTVSHNDFWVVSGNRVDDARAALESTDLHRPSDAGRDASISRPQSSGTLLNTVSRPSSTSALHRSDLTARKHSHMRPAP